MYIFYSTNTEALFSVLHNETMTPCVRWVSVFHAMNPDMLSSRTMRTKAATTSVTSCPSWRWAACPTSTTCSTSACPCTNARRSTWALGRSRTSSWWSVSRTVYFPKMIVHEWTINNVKMLNVLYVLIIHLCSSCRRCKPMFTPHCGT